MCAIAILHVEDSPLDAGLIHARLEKAGFEFVLDRVECEEGLLAALRARTYDLILADYSLPNFDGLSALEIARRECPHCPFIFVSGVMGEEVAIDTLKRGATDYVLKPRLERLGPAVSRALSEARERAQRQRVEAALREGEVQHRLILDSIKEYAIITIDTRGRITHWSAGAEHVFGRREAEMIGQPIGGIFAEEDDASGLPGRERSEAQARSRWDAEHWYVKGDGARFWGSGVVTPLVDEAGGPKGFTMVLRDLTDRKPGKGGRIGLDVRREGESVVIRIKDNGIGLTPQMCTKVFDLFIQVDPSLDRGTGGLGIGLTVARNLVELHGGEINVESEGIGRGSEFTIRLPAASTPVQCGPPRGFDRSHLGPGMDILVVDDSLHSACALAELLRGSGHRVRAVHDGMEAVEAARESRPDAVLLDIGLPSLDGYEVARCLRREGLEDVVIIAITGHGEEQAIRRSREAGFDHHLIKPVDLDALLKLLGPAPTAPAGSLTTSS